MTTNAALRIPPALSPAEADQLEHMYDLERRYRSMEFMVSVLAEQVKDLGKVFSLLLDGLERWQSDTDDKLLGSLLVANALHEEEIQSLQRSAAFLQGILNVNNRRARQIEQLLDYTATQREVFRFSNDEPMALPPA